MGKSLAYHTTSKVFVLPSLSLSFRLYVQKSTSYRRAKPSVGYTTLPLLSSFSLPPPSLPDTPLGLACGRNANVQVIMPLLSNGAHIDFRGKEGLTPLHRAALGGNSAAIKVWICPGCLSIYLIVDTCMYTTVCSITIMDHTIGISRQQSMKDDGFNNSLLVNGCARKKHICLKFDVFSLFPRLKYHSVSVEELLVSIVAE